MESRLRVGRAGLTLLELLVVALIVAVLAALLFPVLAQAKTAAKRAASISNLRQIGMAWSLYNADHEDTLMRTRLHEGAKEVYWWASWDGAVRRPEEGFLHPYTRGTGVHEDPSFPRELRTPLGLTGYGYNYAYLSPSRFSPPDWREEMIPVTASQVASPAETVAFATCARINNWSFARAVLEGSTYLDPPSFNFPGLHGRHGGVANVLWCDGHATARPPLLRAAPFGFGFDPADFKRHHLGDLDRDGNFATDELFDLN